MSTGTALDVTILKNNNKLTRFYTGMPSYDSFLAIVDYLEPKAKEMIGWNSSKTKELNISGKQCVPRCFSSMSIANQLFSVLIRLRLGLLAADVSMRFKISESTYCRLFTTWICFLSKELRLLFLFPTRQQVDDWMPRSFISTFPIHE